MQRTGPWLLPLLAAGLAWPVAAHAGLDSLRFCASEAAPSAQQQDRLLQVAAIVQQLLAQSPQSVALVARAGLNLQRFGVRYTHAGFSLRDSPNGPWSVRQLYYACDEGRPRLYDQGLPGFVSGTDQPDRGHLAIVLLPTPADQALARVALHTPTALALLAGDYSANAHAHSLRYQNCNQWVAELLATAWGGLADVAAPRAQAQAWLQAQGYVPAVVPVGSHLWMWAGSFVPWIRYDDHPEQDRFALQFRVSLPSAIEAFVQRREPQAQRIELCHQGARVVLRRGWRPLGAACQAEPGDQVLALQ